MYIVTYNEATYILTLSRKIFKLEWYTVGEENTGYIEIKMLKFAISPIIVINNIIRYLSF